MLKEQKVELKLIEKIVENTIKEIVKSTKYKKISCYIYEIIKDYFVYAVYIVRPINNQYNLNLRLNIKPYKYDNIFWEVFDMKENIKERDSLRANGAFSVPSLWWDDLNYVITDYSCINQICNEAIDHFRKESTKFITEVELKYNDFDSYIIEQENIRCMDKLLLKMLAYINMKKYEEAIKIAITELNRGSDGAFKNKGTGIYEYILRYCQEKV